MSGVSIPIVDGHEKAGLATRTVYTVGQFPSDAITPEIVFTKYGGCQ